MKHTSFFVILSILLLPFCGDDEVEEGTLTSFQVAAPTSITLGTPFELEIKALNEAGQIYAGFSGEEEGAVNLSTSGTGIITPASINTGGVGVFSDGVAKFEATYDGATTLPETVTITAVLSTDSSITGTSVDIEVTGAEAELSATLELTGAEVDLSLDPPRMNFRVSATFINEGSSAVTGVAIRVIAILEGTPPELLVTLAAQLAQGEQFDGTVDAGETVTVRYASSRATGTTPETWPCGEPVSAEANILYDPEKSITASSMPRTLECPD